ncbi:MAG: hypothetical protein KGI75_28780 [Rhizobiaceae bacterium]|nr:hypothetical protein [Rhizobiaceae bacterium]
MNISRALSAVCALLLLPSAAVAAGAEPQNFLFMSSDALAAHKAMLSRDDIGGVQVVYSWKSLEPEKGRYDFSAIERDLALTTALNKKLFIQVQDRFFQADAKNVPDYLMHDPEYDGGIAPQFDNPGENKPVASGWVARQWNSAVRDRYQALLAALAAKFDGKVYGVNLPETSIDLDMKGGIKGFSCDAYFEGEMQNLAFAAKTFSTSRVVQYVNFWPCEWDNSHNYMGRLFDFASKNHIGLGGPDIVPYRKGQMKNSYPFFHQYKGKLALVAMAVQEPTLTYRNPQTGKPFTKPEFQAFATDYLGADIIFWSTSAPWLKP